MMTDIASFFGAHVQLARALFTMLVQRAGKTPPCRPCCCAHSVRIDIVSPPPADDASSGYHFHQSGFDFTVFGREPFADYPLPVYSTTCIICHFRRTSLPSRPLHAKPNFCELSTWHMNSLLPKHTAILLSTHTTRPKAESGTWRPRRPVK